MNKLLSLPGLYYQSGKVFGNESFVRKRWIQAYGCKVGQKQSALSMWSNPVWHQPKAKRMG